MKHRSILIPAMLGMGILILSGLHGCTGREPGAAAADENTGRKAQAINLFPRELSGYDNTGKLSLDEAFARSRQVVRTAYLRQIGNSNGRSARPFYLYQADGGSFEKPADAGKDRFPLLFLSKQQLFSGKILRDSVHLFLAPLHQYRVLQENMDIKYAWVQEAPFLKR